MNLLYIVFSLATARVLAAGAEIGGNSGSVATPYVPVTEIVKSIYDVALMAGGILAFGAIVYGAARYTMAAGNPSGQHEGKDAITQALLGLLLLFASYLVLHTVNPTLTTLRLPKLVGLTIEKDTGQKACSGSDFGYCLGGDHCIRTNPGVAFYQCVTGTVVAGYGCAKTGSPNEVICSPSNNLSCADIACGGTCGSQEQCLRKPAPAGSLEPCGQTTCPAGQKCVSGGNGGLYCVPKP